VQKLLVTGVDGVAGSNLALALATRFEVVGLYERHTVSFEGCRTSHCELADEAKLADRIREESPAAIIHCGCWSKGTWDLRPSEPSTASMPDETRIVARMAESAAAAKSWLAVLSTDAVFSGPRLFHEEDAATLDSGMASSAIGMERTALARGAMVVRTHPYGWSPVEHECGFAERVWRSLTDNVPCRCVHEHHATPILATDLAAFLARSWEMRLTGLYHIAGAERTSPARFASELAAAFGLRGVACEPSDPLAGTVGASRPESSLSTRKVRRELKLPMPLLREGLDRFADQAEKGFRARVRGAPRGGSVSGRAA